MAVTFDGFSLEDSNYIISELDYKGGPRRDLIAQKTSRRPGVKYTNTEFSERTIRMSGFILGSSVSDLKDKIDNMFKNVVRKPEGTLSIDSDRSISAISSNVIIQDSHYNQTFIPFELEFKSTEPYWKGAQQTIDLVLVSGTGSFTYSTTISGSAFAEPYFTYSAPAGSGDTTISGISIAYGLTGQSVTWSGTGSTNAVQYSDVIQFDWAHQIITRNQANEEPFGVFARWEPGDTSFTVTFSGTTVGGTLQMAYQPRYF